MNITDIFIRRPVLASVVSLMILVLGLRAIQSLELRQYPKTENTLVRVTTTYPGASSELVKGFITTPLQQAIAERAKVRLHYRDLQEQHSKRVIWPSFVSVTITSTARGRSLALCGPAWFCGGHCSIHSPFAWRKRKMMLSTPSRSVTPIGSLLNVLSSTRQW